MLKSSFSLIDFICFFVLLISVFVFSLVSFGGYVSWLLRMFHIRSLNYASVSLSAFTVS